MRRFTHTSQSGATLVEVLVAIALTGIMLPALATALVSSHTARPTTIQQLQATALLREATDALRSVREAGWSNVAADGTYHPVVSGSAWTLAGGAETIDGFSRQIVISDAERDSSGAIVISGGTVDPSTKHVTITVGWTTPSSSSLTNTTFLTRWQHDTAWQQTTQTDFNAGTLTNTVTTVTSDGEVQLSGTPGSYTASGDFESSTFDAGSNAAYNRLDFTASVPGDASLKFQVAVNDDNSTWNYVGPDGTGSSFYTSPGQVPLAAAAGRYIRYKAFLMPTSDLSQTPVITDVEVNYSL